MFLIGISSKSLGPNIIIVWTELDFRSLQDFGSLKFFYTLYYTTIRKKCAKNIYDEENGRKSIEKWRMGEFSFSPENE